MDDPNLLSDVNRWVGVGVAFAGLFVVSPSGTGMLLGAVKAWTRHRGSQVLGWLARLRLLRRHPVQASASGVGTGTGTVTASGTITASARTWRPTAPIDERVEALHQLILEVEGLLNPVSGQLREETATRERVAAELERTLKAETAALRALVGQQEHQAAEIDARGLPVVGFGILLSGVPDQLASIPYGVGWLFPIVGVIVAVTAVVHAWRERHAHAGVLVLVTDHRPFNADVGRSQTQSDGGQGVRGGLGCRYRLPGTGPSPSQRCLPGTLSRRCSKPPAIAAATALGPRSRVHRCLRPSPPD